MNVPYGGLDEPTHLLLDSTSVTDVFTMAAGSNQVTSLHSIVVVNQDSSTRKISVWRTVDSTDYRIFESTIPANETVQFEFQVPLNLYAKATARKIRAQAATANVLTVTLITSTASKQQANAG